MAYYWEQSCFLQISMYPEMETYKSKKSRNSFKYNNLYFYLLFDTKFKLEETRKPPF